MATKKEKKMYGIIGVVLVAIIALLAISQPFALFTEAVWIPQYLSASCEPRADNLAQLQITSHTDNPTFYHCTTEEAKKYIPIVSGIQCEYSLEKTEGAFSVYVCDGITNDQKDLNTNKCEQKSGIFSSAGTDVFYVNA